MTTNDRKPEANNQNNHDDSDALVARWHEMTNSACDLAENDMITQAVYQHQQALVLARELSWIEAELFNLHHLINLSKDLGHRKERDEYLREGIVKADELEEADTKAWLCYQLAETLWPEDKSQAFHWYKTALETTPFPDDWSSITLYCLTLGLHLRDEQRHTEAAALYEKAGEQAAKVRDIVEILSFRLKAAEAYLAVNNWEMAIEQLQLTLALPGIREYPEKAAELWEELGDAYYLSGQQMQAKSIFEQAVELSRQLGNDNSQINQLLKLGRTYRAVGDPTAAEMVISKVLRMARQQQDLKRIVEALQDLSKTKLMLGEQETAVIPLQEALFIVRSLDDFDLELDCLANLASVYQQIGLTMAAAETAVSGLELAFQGNKVTNILAFLSILSSIQDLPHALWSTVDEIAKLALERSQHSEYPLALSECLSVLGGLYIERDPQQALAYYQQLANLFQAQDNVSRYITICGLIASAYQYLDDFERAIHTLQEGLHHIEKYGNSYLVQEIDILLHLAYLYWGLGNLSRSETCLKSITQKVSIDKLDLDRAFQIIEQQGDLYFAQGNYSLAENAYQAALNLLEQQFYRAVTPNVRLKVRAAGRFLYPRLILASVWQFSKVAAERWRTFEHVEAARSRLFLSQLGQTTIRPPQQIPNYLFVQEQELLTQFRQIGQQAIAEAGARHLEEQRDLWHKLQQLWREMELLAGEYVALRRGQPFAWPQLQACLHLRLEDEAG